MGTRRLVAIVNRPQSLVNRTAELECIRQAIFDEGEECRIVLIEGAGGLGKTRLVEEVLWRLGNTAVSQTYAPLKPEDDWSHLMNPPIVANLIDFTEIKLHIREYFLARLSNSQFWMSDNIRFTLYEKEYKRYQRLLDQGADFSKLKDVAANTETAFWQDYTRIAQHHRLVIPMDTAEQLAIISSQWMLDHELLTPKDMLFNTQRWLLENIEAGKFRNSTLLISGRDDEQGESYFALLRETINKASYPCRSIPVPIKAFDPQETRAYFATLYTDLEATLQNEDSEVRETAARTHAVLQYLLSEKERLHVLWLYTGGQPIRLSLYTDILVNGRTIPEPLQDSLADAQKRARSDGTVETDELREARRKIETEFIQILFGGGNDLQARLLRSLSRCTNGLTPKELHFILDSGPNTSAAEWTEDENYLKQIEIELESLKTLSFVKPKPRNRLGLQDEMYRIFAEAMSADPLTREKEKKARNRVYGQLSELANHRRQQLNDKDYEYTRQGLERIRVERPSIVLNSHMPAATEIAEKKRLQLTDDILNTELEYLHYSLLLDPNNFNDTYYKLTQDRVNAYHEEEFALYQAEMWRVLNNPYAFAFIDLPTTPAVEARQESPLAVLRRAVQINDATSWIMRFYMRKEYRRAIELADRIDAAAAALTGPHEDHAWNHTLSRGERAVWRERNQITLGSDIAAAIQRLGVIINDLVALSQATMDTVALPERGENGFIGHPAYPRLIALLSLAYTTLGLGQVNLGNSFHAARAYASAIKYIRYLPFLSISTEEATVRNNLSRALVEMGKKRAIRVCKDALALRIRLGDWLPIAYSYNTLGLIYNDLYMPREALEVCARALAIGRRIQDERLLGLVLIQLGEALRRLVASGLHEDTPEQIYREAESALTEARDIFLESAAKEEGVRPIEVYIELGCLYRDWMARTDKEILPDERKQRYSDALYYLEEAVAMAKARKLVHLQLDAHVNIGWTHAAAGDVSATLSTLQEAVQLIPQGACIQANAPSPDLTTNPDYIFKQLSKVHGLYSLMAMDAFRRDATALVHSKPKLHLKARLDMVLADPELRSLLEQAAHAYVLALAYAQLFSPRSAALTIIYDRLYESVKRLNRYELELFYRYQQEANEIYRIVGIKSENFGDLGGFLLDCFGDYYPAT